MDGLVWFLYCSRDSQESSPAPQLKSIVVLISYLFYTEWNKSEREKQMSYINAYMWNLKKIDIDALIYKAEIETQT